MAKKKTEAETAEQSVLTFPKKDFLKSVKYAKHVDIINGLLKADKSYSIAEVDKLIEDFRTGKYAN